MIADQPAPVRMFKLADRRDGGDGPYCGPDGLYLGGAPLVTRDAGRYRVRAEDEIAAVLAAAYGPAEPRRLLPGLRSVAAALREGDAVQAMLTTLHLRLGELSEAGLAHVAKTDALLKHNFNPDEPRVPAGNPDGGQWTADGGQDAASLAGSETPNEAASDAPSDLETEPSADASAAGQSATAQNVADTQVAETPAERKIRCLAECYYILDQPLPSPGSDERYWAFQRCINECMARAG